MANIEEGVRRLALALAGLGAGGWILFSGFVLLSDNEISYFVYFGFGGGVLIFGIVWTLVRVLGWAIAGFVDRK